MGDIRGVNNGLLDTYQLKSLDGLAEMDVTGMNISRNADGRLSVKPARKFCMYFCKCILPYLQEGPLVGWSFGPGGESQTS